MRGIKILVGIFTILAVMGISLGALITPLPIAVKLDIPNNVEACYYGVKITNLRTGEVITGTTNNHLEYLIDWANSELKYQTNDVFKIEVVGEEIQLRYTATPPTELVNKLTGEDVDYLTIEVSESKHYEYCLREMEYEEEESCPVCEVCPECEVCVDCLDCICEECPDCVCPEDNTPYKNCNSCCENCPDCEGTDMNTLILYLLSFFGISLASGEGYKFVVRKRKGSGKLEMKITQHKHRNQSYYHSIYTIHKKQPHPKGCVNPNYDQYGRFINCGGKK
ncbi:MAG: hypothetical protein KAW47_11120 [Thermoplasmatales archaeon]|nr:hypothetical protein [Thermoplasmatales archaeon]